MYRSLALIGLLAPAVAVAVPLELTHQGRLLDDVGLPLDGDHEITFALYDAPTDGELAWSEVQDLVIDDGYYSAILGTVSPLDSSLLDDPLWLSLSVDGDALPTRLPLTSAPFALVAGRAEVADRVEGDVDAGSVSVGGATVIDADGRIAWSSLTDVPTQLDDLGCDMDQILRFDGVVWTCVDADLAFAHVHHADDLTDGTLSTARLPIGTSSDHIAAGDHGHAIADLTGDVPVGKLPIGSEAGTVAAGDHGHDLADLGGSVPVNKLPVGTGEDQVAPGVHDHDAADISSGTLAIGRLPVGSGDGQVAPGVHGHPFTAITGQALVEQLPVGTGSGTVAAGDHGHDIADVSGQVPVDQLPVGTGPGQVAPGVHDHGASLADLSCEVGDSPVWTGDGWGCDRKPSIHVIATPQNVQLSCTALGNKLDIAPPQVPSDAVAILANVFTYHDGRDDHANHTFGRHAGHQSTTWDDQPYKANTWLNDVIVTHHGNNGGSDYYGMTHGTQFIPLKANGRFDAKLCGGVSSGTHYITMQVNGYVR